MRHFIILFLMFFLPLNILAQKLLSFPDLLEKRIQAESFLRSNPAMNRFRYMRFYVPNDTVQKQDGFWDSLFDTGIEQEHIRATAFYLFNMYITSAAYRQPLPAHLTLNHLGVLDSFVLSKKPFNFSDASFFYSKHKDEIKKILSYFFDRQGLISYNGLDSMSDKAEMEFMKLLERTPQRNHKAVYMMPKQNLLQSFLIEDLSKRLGETLKKAIAEGREKIVIYKEANLKLQDLDTKIRPHKSGINYYYRCVNDECSACTYHFGKILCQRISAEQERWGDLRVYEITAYPENHDFLRPVEGRRFVLADGTSAPVWKYHTAMLIIGNTSEGYSPMIVDKFLAGEEPLSLEKWLKMFSVKTVFTVIPFIRREGVEKQIVEPTSRGKNSIKHDGRFYTPYPVLK